jgi:hypothetical protein
VVLESERESGTVLLEGRVRVLVDVRIEVRVEAERVKSVAVKDVELFIFIYF